MLYNQPIDPGMVRDMSDALAVRAGLSPSNDDGWRNFRGRDLLGIAEDCLARGGVNVQTLGRAELVQRALSTSDFLAVINATGEKLVRDGYSAFPLAHRTCFRRSSAPNFKELNRPLVSAGNLLEKVPENGVIQRQGASVETASYKIGSYGGIIAMTRQLIINDDFDAFASIARQRGRSAAETERRIVWDLIRSNPQAMDGIGCFDASHNNTDSKASGACVSAETLRAARKALRAQTSPDGVKIGAAVRYVVCGPDAESLWEALLSDRYFPTDPSTVVSASLRSVEVLVEPEIEGESFWAFADWRSSDTFEYAYLGNADGPRLDQRNGFDVDGVELKVGLDFGAGLIDYRGCYRLLQS